MILGIDPSLSKTGWGIISCNKEYIDSGIITTSSKDEITGRLLKLYSGIDEIIKKYSISYVAIEETFININGRSSLKLGIARGALITAVAINNLAIQEYSPCQIKKLVTGRGHCDKKEILIHVQQTLQINKPILHLDESDALAIALAYNIHSLSYPAQNSN